MARKLVGLVWDSKDVIDTYATLFSDDLIAPQMDMPRRYRAEYFGVQYTGSICGCATSRVYSPKLRRMISLAVIDKNVIEAGEEVSVIWAKGWQLRATIVPLPFKPDNRRVDVRTM